MPDSAKNCFFKKVVLHGLALAVLIAVFVTYLRPEFLVSMADQLWSCF